MVSSPHFLRVLFYVLETREVYRRILRNSANSTYVSMSSDKKWGLTRIASLADLVNEQFPDWRSTVVNLVRPSCVPCPPHAQCFSNLELRCMDDYIYKPHPFGLNGLLPLVGECIPDTAKQRRIAIVAERALKALRDKAARVECEGETPTGMTEKEIYAELVKYKSGTITDKEFEALFEAAIGELEKLDEIMITPSLDGSKYIP